MNAPTLSSPVDEKTLRRIWLDRLANPADELGELAVLDVQKRLRSGATVSALDADGCDKTLALRLARAGANVLAIDFQNDGCKLLAAAEALGVADKVQHLNWETGCGGSTVPLPGGPFDLVTAHASLSVRPYAEGVWLIRELLLNTRFGGRLYLSAYGLHSELGDDYPDAGKPVRERFAPLAPVIADRYDIAGPVCLYSERELFLLLFEAGASVLRTFTTTHGNVKAIGVRV